MDVRLERHDLGLHVAAGVLVVTVVTLVETWGSEDRAAQGECRNGKGLEELHVEDLVRRK